MKITETPISGVLLIEPRVFSDSRGAFFESFNAKSLKESGIDHDFVQDNQSVSKKGVIRGLHFQRAPFEQGKLVRVIKGSVVDVALDLRKDSPTFGRHFDIELNDRNNLMLWIPPGFAHGFSVLEESTIFSYKVTNYYHSSSESGIIYNDIDLNINWGIKDGIVSEKDKVLPSYKDYCLSL
ncbi:MAG TPA: dTDP-4-dehydrorhamnose 3,5-epimerase [Bacteroidia bacterium]|nr:dTDP-4-dehydrorhamnose 3,5-epimerase [Bacteroidota bacterium]MBP9789263.1 dTDP-4-dehydrorhamnose 3,5-epimerase [Bacteroidia bacterium]MBK7430382.1 dTDP-4-dehydrorhamnose 3,5-epimerase [Bacteroidota bacterium]MBK7573541.1 dTDP-4-dehydrorhamnose 3,5-epimerase [Bacteroidota bacterium]MBK8585299.1 dTDP-4-dehydrorhamnose 3,5-epimerase [Bacteroidota bacterium]